MNEHESVEDFSWQENKEFSEIICEGFKQREIEDLEAMADAAIIDLGDGRELRYKGFNPDVEDYTPGVDDDA